MEKYRCVLADPAWKYADKMANMQSTGDGAASKYNVMSESDIQGFPFMVAGIGHEKDPGSPPNLWSQFADDCVLWLWITNAFLEAGHRVVRAWGFAPKTMATWVKGRLAYSTDDTVTPDRAILVQHIGQGHFLRNSTEHVILATRGKVIVNARNIPTAFVYPGRWPGRLHSEKPTVIHEWAERLSAGPRLELFARTRRPGWDAIGDQL